MLGSSSQQQQQNGTLKRRRTVISCTECHRRKQKCDRQYPCCNCVRRQRQGLCRYDRILENRKLKPSIPYNTDSLEISDRDDAVNLASLDESDPKDVSSSVQSSLEEFGYSSRDNYNSMSLLRMTELYQDRERSLVQIGSVNNPTSQNDVHRRYIELVRRLPRRALIDTLVRTFFTFVNWQYDLLDNEIFQEQLKVWGSVSYSSLREGLTAIRLETLVFAALLFQVLAQALLVHSPHDRMINDLMVMADMTFHDLATEYSNTGAEMLLLLGKGGITTATIQAGLLRASFLKHRGSVVDAWHVLGATIRDAQEIGLHNGQCESEQHCSDTEVKTVLKAVGQKVWVVLHIWDSHMAVVLSRPMATNLQVDSLARTIKDDERRRELFAHWQTEHESPRPFDIIIAGYTVAYQYFKDIHYLEHHNSEPADYVKVEQIHASITSNLQLLPSWCRLENPSTRFDQNHGCHWLPAARQGLYSLIHLVLLTLHRPHIFSNAKSRMEALKAGESILQAQQQLFEQLEAHQRNSFTLVYASFDAIVLIAAICLTFPTEYPDRQAKCVEAIERGIRRLDIAGRCNRMARAAHGVALSLYDSLTHRPNARENIDGARSLEQVSLGSYKSASNLALSEFSFDAIQPPRPVHDLFYDHVSSTQFPVSNTLPDQLSADSPPWNFTDNWRFEGDFTDTSFWGILNDFHSCA